MGHSALHEIRALKAAELKSEIFDKDHKLFPKITNLEVSVPDDVLYELGDKLGLSTAAIQNTFVKGGKPLRLRVTIEFDGSMKVTHLNDIPLTKATRITP